MISFLKIKDKPLISVFEAEFQGKLGGFLSKNKLKTIDFIEIKTNLLDRSVVRYIPFKKILAVGENAVTVPNNLCIISAENINFDVYKRLDLGLFMYENSGDFLGNLSDVILNEKGEVLSLKSESVLKTADLVKSVSRDMLIFGEKSVSKRAPKRIAKPKDDQAVFMLEADEGVHIEDATTFSEGFTLERHDAPSVGENSETNELAENEYTISDPAEAENQVFAPSTRGINLQLLFNEGEPVPKPIPTPEKLISDYKFLLGRLVSEDIYDAKREAIIRAGTVITAAVVKRARQSGRLVELTVSSKS